MTAKTCQSCGALFYNEETQGLCPRCLAQSALAPLEEPQDASPAGKTTNAAAAETHPPSQSAASNQAPVEYFLGLEGNALGKIGDYELIRELGRGGMGVVYLARQMSLNRQVAFKMILAGPFASPAAVRRFRTEAEAAARLRHPNIVTIFETGEFSGKPYYSMQYVRGPSLADRIQDTTVPPDKAAQYTRTIARAVQHAHEQGILHRDLKPSNVLLDAQDEPHVSDFGLAKEFQTSAELTVSGECLGSPNFMPPEQASEKHGKVSVRSDVYAIGTTLYFLLTGHPPFKAATVSDTLEQLLHHEPVAPRLLNASIPADLETICLKCLEKEPEKRYPTAQALADDLDRFLLQEPIHARPATPIEKLAKWGRRKPALAGLSAAVLILFLSVLIGSPIALNRIKKERDLGQALLYAADMNYAFQALKENRLDEVRDLLQEHIPDPGEEDLRHWEYGHLWRESQSDEIFSLSGNGTMANCVAFSPDGRYLAAGFNESLAQVWDFESRELVTKLSHPPQCAVNAMAFSPNGKYLLTGEWVHAGETAHLRVWEVETWEEKLVLTNMFPIKFISVSADNRFFAVVNGRRQLEVRQFNLAHPVPLDLELRPRGSGSPMCFEAAFSDSGSRIVFPEHDRISIWDLEESRKLQSVPLSHPMPYQIGRMVFYGLALSPDQSLLALTGDSPQVFDLSQSNTPNRLPGNLPEARWVAFSPDGTKLALAHVDRSVSIWDTRTWKRWGTLRGHLLGINDLAFSPDSQFLATGSRDHTVKIWDLRTPPRQNPTHNMPPHNTEKTTASFSSGQAILGIVNTNHITITKGIPDVHSISNTLPYAPLNGVVHVSPQGNLICFADADGNHGIWEASTMTQISRITNTNLDLGGHRTFSPDEKLIAGYDTKKKSRVIWSIPENTAMAERITPGEGYHWWGADSRTLMIPNYSTALLWDIQSDELRETIPHDFTVCAGAMSRDGILVATMDWGGGIKVFENESLKLRFEIDYRDGVEPMHLLAPMDFSPDHRRLAVVGGRSRLTLYDTLTGRAVGSPILDDVPHGCRFSQDGNWISVGHLGFLTFLRSTPLSDIRP